MSYFMFKMWWKINLRISLSDSDGWVDIGEHRSLLSLWAIRSRNAISNTKYTIIEGHCLGIVIPTTNNRCRTLKIPIPRFKHDRFKVQAAKPEFNHVIVQPVNTCLYFDLEHSVRLGGLVNYKKKDKLE